MKKQKSIIIALVLVLLTAICFGQDSTKVKSKAVQCTAMTLKKEQCKRTTTNKEKLCFQHLKTKQNKK